MEDRRSEFGKYRIDSILGEGGMGVVYKGYDPLIARVVAIKTIHNNLLEGTLGNELRNRFRREARAVGRLTHQNIIAIYEYDEEKVDGTPYFVMEFVEGREINDCIREGESFSLERAIGIIEQVLSALGYAHSLGVIHRDIKPANIILLENDRVKIADFGIARVQDLDATQLGKTRLKNPDLTQAGMVLGSPRYMSPEQCLGREVDPRSDLYSTALVLYELVTGTKAFSGRSAHNLAERLQNPIPPAPKTDDPKVLNLYNRVLKKALAKEPDDRYQSAEAFVDALRSFAAPGRRPSGANVPWRWAAGAAVLLVAGLSGWFWMEQGTGEYVPPAAIIDTSKQVEPLSPEQEKKVTRLLRVAKTHILVGRLVSPMGSNAYYAFNLVQQIDPRNQEAANGIRTISVKLEQQIEQLIKDGKKDKAQDLITEGLKYFPNHPALERINQTFEKNG
ncbi:serine/threonine-protein kinase [Motiliproteus sp. MSK22-1]|uniref:serine/threonine-protein kinase n=1 Tax=Motiliproteus sp. MSK22-1 TaxID=1897630 RepID=UPI000977A155|nr:serine/threonine-protein kinase [Motiliproteus sp. MSK22-1]OMH39191.1 hypothetical protein BGP75_05720 [Motiliproteus sp. MSK22-1]